MRLPSVNELFRMTDRISEHNRMFGHHNSPPASTQKPSEGFIDLTLDSSQESFNPSDYQQYSSTNSSFRSHPIDTSYIDLEFVGMARRSREPTISRPRQNKRRRRNDSDSDLITISSSTFPTSTNSFSPPTNPSNRIEFDLRDSFDDRETAKTSIPSSSTNKPKSDIAPSYNVEEEEEINPKDEQDRQLADTIKAQAGIPQGASKLNQLTCIICMDNMTNMTATMCGHVFCHTCIMEALIAGENRTDGRPAPKCPMCRTRIRRKVPKGVPDVIPLTLKLMTRGKKAKEKQREILS